VLQRRDAALLPNYFGQTCYHNLQLQAIYMTTVCVRFSTLLHSGKCSCSVCKSYGHHLWF